MLTSGHPSHARDLIRMFLGPFVDGTCGQLIDLVRNRDGDITRATGGVDFYTFINQPDQQEFFSTFGNAMAAFSKYNGDKLAAAVNFGNFSTIVDIGGNHGTFLAEILHHHPTIKHGIVFDLPKVIAQAIHANEFLSRSIPADKVTFVAGDMFDSSTIPQSDAYVLKHLLHDFGDEQVVAVLVSVRMANENCATSTTVFIVEHIILSDGALSNWQAHTVDVGMGCAVANAQERTEQEYGKLLKQAGYQIKQLYPVQAPNSIIEAIISK